MTGLRFLRFAPLLSLTTSAFAVDPEFSDVFTSGSEGYASIRIPAALVTKESP